MKDEVHDSYQLVFIFCHRAMNGFDSVQKTLPCCRSDALINRGVIKLLIATP
jgi:hypothetical protein